VSSSKKPPKKAARARGPASRKAAGGRKTVSARKPAAKPRPPSKAPPRRAPKAPPRPARKVATSQPRAKAASRQKAAPTPAPEPRSLAPPPRPTIRLPGSASSRLTIKPGPPQGPRPQLELSTRPRPSGPRKLSEVDLDEDEVLIDGFDAILEGQKVRITAVLERTCVYLDRGGDRKLARKEDLWVEADKLPIHRRGIM
jgi:hypothetical protein